MKLRGNLICEMGFTILFGSLTLLEFYEWQHSSRAS
jgi:hypothetical protein